MCIYKYTYNIRVYLNVQVRCSKRACAHIKLRSSTINRLSLAQACARILCVARITRRAQHSTHCGVHPCVHITYTTYDIHVQFTYDRICAILGILYIGAVLARTLMTCFSMLK